MNPRVGWICPECGYTNEPGGFICQCEEDEERAEDLHKQRGEEHARIEGRYWPR